MVFAKVYIGFLKCLLFLFTRVSVKDPYRSLKGAIKP